VKLRSIVVLVSLALGTSAAAQPKDPGEAAFQEGRKAYDLQEWDKAIEKFKEAYRIRSDGASLFNIAQSYRLKGDCVEAIGFYKTFKRNFPNAPNLAAVEDLIKELEPCEKERTTQKTTPTPEQPPPAQPPVVQPKPEPRTEDRGKGKRMTGLVVAGSGALLVGTGVAFGVMAKGKSDDVSSGGDPQSPTEFDKSLEDSGKRFDLMAKISWGVGGAAIVGGVVLYLLGNGERDVQVGVTPTQGGAVFAYGSAF
jgi:tetratricopeptide (TPR) repeat protein